VSGICGPGKIRLMAAIAGRWQRCVVIVRVATRTSNSRVCSRQREGRVVMIESRRRPG